jgi:tetratricopeptide (TPR) repeat protein
LQIVNDSRDVYPTSYLVLGQAFVAIQDYSSALRWLDQTPTAYQNYGIYWEYRGRALEGLGDGPGAIASYRRMGNYPDRSEIPLRLGNLLLQDGQVDAAREVLVDLVAKNPASAAAWNSLGISHAFAGDKLSAHDAFKRAVQLAPDNSRYRENLERAAVK